MSEDIQTGISEALHHIEASLKRVADALQGLENRMNTAEKELAARANLNWSHLAILFAILVPCIGAGMAFTSKTITVSQLEVEREALKREMDVRGEIRGMEEKIEREFHRRDVEKALREMMMAEAKTPSRGGFGN